MKLIRVIKPFNDKVNKTLRTSREEYKCDDARAELLIEKGYAILLKEIEEPKVEVAVKDNKKEKAVKKVAKK